MSKKNDTALAPPKNRNQEAIEKKQKEVQEQKKRETEASEEEKMADSRKRAQEFMDNEYMPEKIEQAKQNKEEFNKIIDDESRLLNLFREERYIVPMDVLGEHFDFRIRPIEKGDDLSFMDLDNQIFNDIADEDKKILDKWGKGLELTPEEMQQMQKFEAQMKAAQMENGESASDNGLDSVHKLLASQVTPPAFESEPDPDLRFKMKVEFWKKFPFMQKLILFRRTSTMLGLAPEQVGSLFQIS